MRFGVCAGYRGSVRSMFWRIATERSTYLKLNDGRTGTQFCANLGQILHRNDAGWAATVRPRPFPKLLVFDVQVHELSELYVTDST